MRAAAAVLAAALLAFGPGVRALAAEVILKAEYIEPTTRYPHGVLGDNVEWGALKLTVDQCPGCDTQDLRDITIRLPETRVFEDVAPRLVDLEGAGRPDVIVVESDQRLGARLAIYDEGGLVAATDFIGQRNRWLAPVGAADLDGDGVIEIAYVDRPHLAKTLRVFRFANGNLMALGSHPGVTNHRIGEPDIAGGIRTCDQGPEMIVATADWSRLLAVQFDGSAFSTRDIGAHRGRDSFARAMTC